MELNEMIKRFAILKEQEDQIKAEKDILSKAIMNQMVEKKVITEDGYKAQKIEKQNITYTDEAAIIRYLKKNRLSNYVVEKINTTELNKQLKLDKSILKEDLNRFYNTEVKEVLQISKESK